MIVIHSKMESKIFEAARDGKLYKLKVLLDCRPKEEVALLVSSCTNGATPLLIACINGCLDVALYLIEKCQADIEQVGDIKIDGETILGVTPLWCAAAAGYLNLVRILVRNNAIVNSTTKTNSTPLRAACFDGHFEIVKYLIRHGADIEIANRHGHTCLMIACYKGHYETTKYLVECGADVNRKSIKGNTALHDCAESGSLEILKFLLKNGAKFVGDGFGFTPLLSAAVCGHALIVEYFIQEFQCTKQEKVNALELLGATFLDKKRDMVLALDCWRQAMKLRYEDSKCLLEKPCTQSPIASYVNSTEIRTLAQLEELSINPDEMRMQALLVRDRILGPSHPDTIYFIRYRGATYADNRNFDRCIQLWMYALDVQQKVYEPLSLNTQSSLLAFSELFAYIMSEVWLFDKGFPFVSYILPVFDRTVKEVEAAMKLSERRGQDSDDTSQFRRTLMITMYLVDLMCQLQPLLSKSQESELKKAVYQLVRMNPRTKDGFTLLHLACFKDSSALSKTIKLAFPSLKLVDLLLELGASPNAVDVYYNTPLHVSAMNKPHFLAVFKSLLKHGAHLDLCNSDRQTPLQLVQGTPLLIASPLHYLNLQCLCAQAVRKHNIPYKGFVGKILEIFLDGH